MIRFVLDFSLSDHFLLNFDCYMEREEVDLD